MKLQNMAVIFIIIIMPIILVVSYYISMQVDTINMQTAYNTKLLESTKEAIEAFEINTVEWNEAYSETADSKRRDIMASINTFTTSFANSIGVGGASKETILSYIPAIAYTLYDGYYIYSPTETKVTIKDDSGVAVFVKQSLVNYGSNSGRAITFSDNKYNSNNEGKILYEYDSEKGGSSDGDYNGQAFTLNSAYAKTTYSHILKPFTAYSARYKTGNGLDDTDITVNYTLDNYITIYGIVDREYQKKSGYLIDTEGIDISEGKYEIVKVDGNIIAPETLTEKIWYEGLSHPTLFKYIYESENNTKVYFDGTTPFQVSSSGVRTNLNELSSVKYKKLSIYTIYNGDDSCIEIYQALNDSKDGTIIKGKWYIKKDSTVEAKDYGQNTISLQNDVCAINYYVESYAFSKWAYEKLSDIKVEDMQSQTEHITITTGDIFNKQGIENEDSIFNLHKREVIKQAVISNLNQSITSYSRNSEGEFQLPILSETDWDQILSNVSITTFVQGIPIGMKYYNNYAIATSTSNKEYVDPNEIYLNTSGDTYYHLPYCNKLNSGGNLIGYRSIDYKLKSYGEEENTGYYYKHDNIGNEECYYCLVQRSLYEETPDATKVKAYQTALAREKYAARKTTIPVIVTADTGDGSVYQQGEVLVEFNNNGNEDHSSSENVLQDGYYEIILVAGGRRRCSSFHYYRKLFILVWRRKWSRL